MVLDTSPVLGWDSHANVGKLHTLLPCDQFQPLVLLRAYPGAMGCGLLDYLKHGVERLLIQAMALISQCHFHLGRAVSLRASFTLSGDVPSMAYALSQGRLPLPISGTATWVFFSIQCHLLLVYRLGRCE